jgi:hypothetical protein
MATRKKVKYALLIISEAAVKLGDTTSRLWLQLEYDLPPLKTACAKALRVLDEKGGVGRPVVAAAAAVGMLSSVGLSRPPGPAD